MRTRQWVAMTALVLGAVAMLGCGSDPSDQVKTYYYKGRNTTRSAQGQVTGTGETLLRRVFDGPRSLIVENVLTKSDEQGVQENTLNFQVTGSAFADPDTGFTGELVGQEAWDWIQWTATGTLPDGLTIVSVSSINEGKVIVDMSFKQGDTVEFTVKHEVSAIMAEHFDELRSQWLASP
jgi:hypothetical protein